MRCGVEPHAGVQLIRLPRGMADVWPVGDDCWTIGPMLGY